MNDFDLYRAFFIVSGRVPHTRESLTASLFKLLTDLTVVSVLLSGSDIPAV